MFARATAIGLMLVPLMAGAAQEESTLDLTPKSFQAGMGKHLKEIPQCAAAKLSKADQIKDGRVVYHTLTMNGASVEVLLDLGKAGKIAKAKFTGAAGANNDAQLRAMMCSTYAVMRTLQPDYETPDQAQSNMSHLWKSAASKPFTKAFYFNTIKAQYVPFEMNVY